MDALESLVKLAIEHWRILRLYERAIALSPPDHHAKNAAQLRYAHSRLSAILGECGLRLVDYDGEPYSPNLPVVAVNGDEFGPGGKPAIGQTLEPTVLHNGEVRAMGKVILHTSERQ